MYPPDAAERRAPATPLVVKTVLLINGLVFLAQLLIGDLLTVRFALWPLEVQPYAPSFHIWQLLTYSVLHGGLLHLLTNMFAMWMFGSQIEHLWGSRLFGVYYLVCVVGAGLVQLVVATLAAVHGDVYPTIGASGGVFGVLLAFGMMFPNQRIVLLIPPIPMKAKWFLILYGAFELYAGITGTMSGVAHFAHLGGMLFGLVLILCWRRQMPWLRAER